MTTHMKTLTLGMLALTGMLFTARADDQATIDALKKTYPLKTCVVSGEKLEVTKMGAPIDYLYTSKDKDGKETTRLVRFCCKSCVKDFNKEPQKYLSKIDAASTAPVAVGDHHQH